MVEKRWSKGDLISKKGKIEAIHYSDEKNKLIYKINEEWYTAEDIFKHLKSNTLPPPSPRSKRDDESIHAKEEIPFIGKEFGYEPLEFEPDSIVKSIMDEFITRAKKGKLKYNTDLDRTDLSVIDWIQHAIEEHMDSIVYLKKLKQILGGKEDNKGTTN